MRMGGGAAEDESEQLAFPPAPIEAVDELVQIALRVLLADPSGQGPARLQPTSRLRLRKGRDQTPAAER
jgi:hypothetical protein